MVLILQFCWSVTGVKGFCCLLLAVVKHRMALISSKIRLLKTDSGYPFHVFFFLFNVNLFFHQSFFLIFSVKISMAFEAQLYQLLLKLNRSLPPTLKTPLPSSLRDLFHPITTTAGQS